MQGGFDPIVQAYVSAADRIASMADPLNALHQCEALLGRVIKLPITLPRITVLSRRIADPWSQALTGVFIDTAHDAGASDVLVPKMQAPCKVAIERHSVEDLELDVGEEELWVNYHAVGNVVELIIESPSKIHMPIAYYLWDDASIETEVTAKSSLRNFMLLSLLVAKNPWITDALPRTVRDVFGDEAFGEDAVQEAVRVADALRRMLEALGAVGASITS